MSRKPPAAAAIGLAAILLTGCAPAPAIDGEASTRLASATQEVRTQIAAGHYAEALTLLDGLEREVQAFANNGKLSPGRKADVITAVAAVRSDLQSLEAKAQDPSPTGAVQAPSATPTQPPKGKGKKSQEQIPPPEDN